MYKRILVPLDGSDTARRGLTEAIGLAGALGASLRLLHVTTDVQWLIESAAFAYSDSLRLEQRRFGEDLLAAAEKLAEEAKIPTESRLREAIGEGAARLIVAEADGCDLIVMGTHGRKGMGRLLLGSDASIVVSDSPVPVLLVRQATTVT